MVLTPEGYRFRYMDAVLEKALRICGAVCIEGPKGCGKTWTSLNHANSALMLDDPSNGYRNRRFAEERPEEAVVGEAPRLIDEWQFAPAVWDSTRRLVDRMGAKGLVILCGSSTPDDGVLSSLHSGFARICPYRMRTMSLFESGDSDGSVSLSSLFRNDPIESEWRDADIGRIIGLILRGGWPGTLGMEVGDAMEFNRMLVESIAEDEAPRIDRTVNPQTVRMLLRSLARNESIVASDRKIRSDMAEDSGSAPMAQETLVKYRGVLERLHIIEDQSAFNPNLRSSVRVGKAPKRHLADPSLAAAAMRATPERLDGDRETLGFLFEALCERDLQIYAESLGGSLFHYRDGNGKEIDAVVEMPDGTWGAFEIKLTRSGVEEGARNLIRIRDYIAGQPGGRAPVLLCVICGTAETAELRDDGVYVVPITMLKA